MRICALLSLSVLLLFLLVPSVRADVLLVPSEYATIQAAIDAATHGDTVLVSPGTYLCAIRYHGKAITVASTDGPEVTILDGLGQDASVVTFTDDETRSSVLEGFTVQRGEGTYRSGLDAVVGLAILIEEASPTIRGNWIVDNRDTGPFVYGGGIYVGGGSPLVLDNVIARNRVGETGGGMQISDGTPVIRRNVIAENRARTRGGGIMCVSDYEVTITDNTFTENWAGFSGAGLCMQHSAQGKILRNEIHDNTTNDTTNSGGGGVQITAYDTDGAIQFSRNRVYRNSTAEDAAGGGLRIRGYNLHITNNEFFDNTGGFGGGVYISGDGHFANNLLYRNTALIRGGGLALQWGEDELVLSGNTIHANDAALWGGAIVIVERQEPIWLINSILWGNTAPTGPQIHGVGGPLSVIHCDVEGGFGGTGVMDAEPLFVNGPDGDLRLRMASPCIDTGDDSNPDWIETLDFEMDDRIVDGDLDGEATIDIGADEAVPETAALFGAVDAGSGSVRDVLFVNGERGDGHRTLEVDVDGPIVFFMDLPPAGGNAKYVVHANTGAPGTGTLTELPAGLGWIGFPLLLTEGATPVAIFNNIGKVHAVGSSRYFDGTPLPPPPLAPADFLDLPDGDPANLPVGTEITIQGVILDPNTTASKPASVTNGVVIRVM